jgi:hypothetical protein
VSAGGPVGEPADEGYDGTAQLVGKDRLVEVKVTLRGGFQPIDGRYQWYGRVRADDAVDALASTGADVVLHTRDGEAHATLSDVDAWGRYRIDGTGRPPFPVC